MKLSRRQFLKLSTVTVGTGALAAAGYSGLAAAAEPMRTHYARETTTICPYCGVGCGAIVHSHRDRVINIEGDPDHPINLGSLCSKGSAMSQLANNDLRLTKVKYRAPGSSQWEEKSWSWAIERIATRVKETRDQYWIENDSAGRANRTEAIACLGGAALDNEECYLYSKLARALGIVYVEHQARI